jgi:tetratricopeptide (TPR) repeat protein
MFKQPIYSFLFVLLSFSSCSIQQVIKKVENQKISVSPVPLERYGDSVKFEIKVELPRQVFHKNANYRMVPEFYFGSQTKVFEAEGLVFEGAKIEPSVTPSKRQSFAMRFEDGMESGTLEMYGVAYSNKGWFKKRTRSYVLARGVKNSPSLTQLGQIYETGNIARIGLYVPREGIATYGMFEEGWGTLVSALRSYSGLGYDEKTEIIDLIQGRGDFTFKERQLQQNPNYAVLRRDIILTLPNLTSGLTAIQKTPMEISVLAHHIINNNAVPQVLTEQELAYAAENEPRMVQKSKLYFAMVKGYPSVFSWNNLGVTYLNLYHREVDRSKMLGHLNAARDAFENANAIFQNPFASFNQALITALLGDYLDAYKEFFISMSLTQSEDIRMLHQAKLGAVSILNGDYRLAAMHLNQSERDQVNLFNRGLAYLMMQDYYNALISFEDCAVKDIENGYPFYGLALIAARNGEYERFFENLQKATEKNEYLKQRAMVDLEFLFYRQEDRFKEIFR